MKAAVLVGLLVCAGCVNVGASPTEKTTAPPTPTTTVVPTLTQPDDLTDDALVRTVQGLRVEEEHVGGYQRELFPHWGDADGDGCNTRAEVLMRDSRTPAQVDPYRCYVVAGDWRSPYDGVLWSDPAEIQIDHVVALSEAWASGAWAWTPEQRERFANDLDDNRTLRAVTGYVNQEKSDKDPAEWLPTHAASVCTYISDWVAIKARWDLSLDPVERDAILGVVSTTCGNSPTSTVEVTTTSGVAVFRNCAEARAAGVTPIRRGDANYRQSMDRDGDGVACE